MPQRGPPLPPPPPPPLTGTLSPQTMLQLRRVALSSLIVYIAFWYFPNFVDFYFGGEFLLKPCLYQSFKREDYCLVLMYAYMHDIVTMSILSISIYADWFSRQKPFAPQVELTGSKSSFGLKKWTCLGQWNSWTGWPSNPLLQKRAHLWMEQDVLVLDLVQKQTTCKEKSRHAGVGRTCSPGNFRDHFRPSCWLYVPLPNFPLLVVHTRGPCIILYSFTPYLDRASMHNMARVFCIVEKYPWLVAKRHGAWHFSTQCMHACDWSSFVGLSQMRADDFLQKWMIYRHVWHSCGCRV